MSYRKIEKVFSQEAAHWVGTGFRVKQYFPANFGMDFMERFSPFILMDYNAPYEFKAARSNIGVGVHPHRGFETVTFSLSGKIEHEDSHGNRGVIDTGDIQWMTAGSGLLHKEFHETEYAKGNRTLHMIQLWVNLPSKYKMTTPKYQALTKDMMGKYLSEDGGIEITVYAGEVMGTKGPASTFSPINIYKMDLKAGQEIEITEPVDFNTGMLVISGKVIVNEAKDVVESDFVLFENDGNAFKVKATEDAEIFVLSGRPLNEPVVAMGPFVMNSLEEIRQAQRDFENGLFGELR